MAIDLTVVLTAAVTGLAGYGGARLQGRVALAQSRAQTAQATAERDQTALEKRQSAYHDLLDVIRELQGQVYGAEPMTSGDLAAWNKAYQHLLNGVELVGVGPVRSTARSFDDVMQSLAARIPANASTFDAGVKAAYDQSQGAITVAFQALIGAMSADVSPGDPSPPEAATFWSRLKSLGRLDSH